MAWGAIGAAIGEFVATYGAAIGAVASVASTAYTMTQDPEGGSMPDQQPITIGQTASPIDKTKMQSDAELGKLDLGEDEMDKKKRKKGKAAFKIALDQEEKDKQAAGKPETGVQVAKPDKVGAQL